MQKAPTTAGQKTRGLMEDFSEYTDDDLFIKAVDCYNNGQMESVRISYLLLNVLVDRNPGYIHNREAGRDNPFYYMGDVAFYHFNNPELAADFYSQAVVSTPEDSMAYQNRGLCRIEMGRPGEALEDLRRAKCIGDSIGMLRPDLDGIIEELEVRSSNGQYPCASSGLCRPAG